MKLLCTYVLLLEKYPVKIMHIVYVVLRLWFHEIFVRKFHIFHAVCSTAVIHCGNHEILLPQFCCKNFVKLTAYFTKKFYVLHVNWFDEKNCLAANFLSFQSLCNLNSSTYICTWIANCNQFSQIWTKNQRKMRKNCPFLLKKV